MNQTLPQCVRTVTFSVFSTAEFHSSWVTMLEIDYKDFDKFLISLKWPQLSHLIDYHSLAGSLSTFLLRGLRKYFKLFIFGIQESLNSFKPHLE
jgi:hypothetical protein